jgi:hypothetical protein
VIVACGIVLTTVEVPAARVADISASISPIGLAGPAGQRSAYFWLDLRNQGPGPQALCGLPSISGGTGNGPRAPAGGFGFGGASHCGGLGTENLIGPGGHLIIGLKVQLTPDVLVQRLTGLTVRTDALTPGGAVLTDANKRAIKIELNGGRLRHLPKFGELPVLTASRNGTSFGGWSAVVRHAGDAASTRPAYWISLVNGRKEGQAVCSAVRVRVNLLAGKKEIRTVEEDKFEGNQCADAIPFGVDTGWRLVGSGQAFTFLFSVDLKPGDEKADRVAFTIQAFEASSKLEQPFSKFSIETIADISAH